jgi:hypothetical protein
VTVGSGNMDVVQDESTGTRIADAAAIAVRYGLRRIDQGRINMDDPADEFCRVAIASAAKH